MTADPIDIILFSKIADGDELAFGTLYRNYVPQILPFIRSVVRTDAVADEIIQETFLRVWLSRDKLPSIQNPRAWIFRIASNICYTHLRRVITERNIVNTFGGQEGSDDVDQQVQAGELVKLIHEAIKELPAQRQKIYRMSREKGLSISEICAELNLSRSTVKNTISSSLDSIRTYLAKNGYTLPIFIISLLFFKLK